MATIERTPAREVLNQPPQLEGYNVFDENRPLVEALRREGAETFEGRARELGARAGTREALERGRLAIASGIHALPWREPVPGAQAGRAAMMLSMSGVESGTGCPLSMTYAGVPALRAEPELAKEWEPRLTSLEYDPRMIPATEKRGALMGMAMTERQGGSDVRSNTTVARPLNGGGPGAEYEIHGHKWFCSAPMCDVFMVLAQADGGLSCFLLPRWTPDGKRNGFHIQRLKDKLGNRSNASSEVEFDGAWAQLVGDEGRGVPVIIEMVNYTRLDCVLGSTGLMRAAVAQAIHHCSHRAAFGKLLADQPLMRNVLADLAVESEAATLTAMRLARACDEGDPFKRLGLAVSKYWICKSAVWHVAEALECLGGNGYVELSGMPRLYREAPLNSIWEGSGNVNCLDVLRGMVRSPESVDVFFAEVESAGGEVADHARRVRDELTDLDDVEFRARRIVESMAIALEASVLVRYGDPAVAHALRATRLPGHPRRALGAPPRGVGRERIVERHRPRV